jgi:hypothetical protein
VGCELDSTVGHEAAWRQVSADVRAVYKDKLTYADDQITTDARAVTWWDAVDLIGQDAYPTLSTRLHPTVAQLRAGWSGYYRLLLRLHRRYDLAVVSRPDRGRPQRRQLHVPRQAGRGRAVPLVQARVAVGVL